MHHRGGFRTGAPAGITAGSANSRLHRRARAAGVLRRFAGGGGRHHRAGIGQRVRRAGPSRECGGADPAAHARNRPGPGAPARAAHSRALPADPARHQRGGHRARVRRAAREFRGREGASPADFRARAGGRRARPKRQDARRGAGGGEGLGTRFIPVDRQMRTNVPHIFAIGDVAAPPLLAHKAMHEGKVAAEVAAGHKRAADWRVIPSVAYTDPEIAWVGLTESDARANGTAFRKGAFPWMANGRSLSLGREEGFTKLLFDPDTHRVLGGGIVGTNAGELISEIALAVETGCDAADIGLTIHPHPTLTETIAGAAEAFEGTLTDLYLPKK